MIGDASEDVSEPRLGVDIVELGGLDQRVDDGGALSGAGDAAAKMLTHFPRGRSMIIAGCSP